MPSTRRVLYACTQCSSSKAKCDLARPCGRCSKKKLECTEQKKVWITEPAQALAGTSDQNLNAPQSRDDELSDDSANLKRRRLQQETRPLPRLPDPQRFNGLSHEFAPWLPSIKAKLRVDGAAIGNAYAQFFYVYLTLHTSVQAKVLPQVSFADEAQRDYNSILDQLTRIYDNPNKEEQAQNNSELVGGTPGGGEVGYTQRDSHTPDQHHQEKPTREEVLGFQVANHATVGLHMSAVSQKINSSSQSNGCVYPPAVFGPG
jgi:hypothetical protein